MTWHESMRESLLRGSDRQLYENSDDFRRAIDMLVAMLPSMVQGLADDSLKMMHQRRHLERAMQRAPMPSFITNPMDPKTPFTREPTEMYWYYYGPGHTVLALADENAAQIVAGPPDVIVFMATIEEVYG